MILKAKDNFGFMPKQNINEFGISPVDGKENKKVWPVGENWFCIVKGESYNVKKEHPFFEGKPVSGSKKVLHDNKPPADSGSRS